MAAGMAGQGGHEDLRRKPVERPDAVEAEPGLAAARVGPPVPHIVPLTGAVAARCNEAPPLFLSRLALGLHDVNAGVGEVLNPARVVEVQVGEHDVAYVARGIAKRLYLVQRRLLHPETDVEQGAEEATETRVGIAHVLNAIAGIDEHQTFVGFNELRSARNNPEKARAESVE